MIKNMTKEEKKKLSDMLWDKLEGGVFTPKDAELWGQLSFDGNANGSVKILKDVRLPVTFSMAFNGRRNLRFFKIWQTQEVGQVAKNEIFAIATLTFESICDVVREDIHFYETTFFQENEALFEQVTGRKHTECVFEKMTNENFFVREILAPKDDVLQISYDTKQQLDALIELSDFNQEEVYGKLFFGDLENLHALVIESDDFEFDDALNHYEIEKIKNEGTEKIETVIFAISTLFERLMCQKGYFLFKHRAFYDLLAKNRIWEKYDVEDFLDANSLYEEMMS